MRAQSVDPAGRPAGSHYKIAGSLPVLPLASCQDIEDSEIFFQDAKTTAENIVELRNICGSCPEQIACLKYAIEENIKEGFWGGKTEHERAPMRIAHNRENADLTSARPFFERDLKIIELGLAKTPYKEIADQFGVTTDKAKRVMQNYRNRNRHLSKKRNIKAVA